MRTRSWWRAWSCAALAGVAMAGCGGGGSTDRAAAMETTLSLQPDEASAEWGGTSLIDVLANDRVSHGSMVLESLTAPSHGTASIVSGKIAYTPAPGYLGTDMLTYTVRAGAGSATASAALSLSVTARLRIAGKVSDGPIANAFVTATVGDAVFSTTADAAGAYTLEVRSANPSDFVSLSASGIGVQSTVRLSALVGEVASLLARAPAGELSLARGFAADITHISTATAALASQANGRTVPVTETQLRDALLTLSPVRLTDIATALKLVVDHGVALPEGVADTMALANSEAAVDTLLATETTADFSRFKAVRYSVQTHGSSALALPLATSAEQTLVYFRGAGQTDRGGTDVVTFRPDGTAVVVSNQGRRNAMWTRLQSGAVHVALEQPFSWDTSSYSGDAQVRIETHAMTYYHASGTASGGLAHRVPSVTTTYLTGPQLGQTFAGHPYPDPDGIVKVLDLHELRPLVRASLPVGSRLAGLFAGELGPEFAQDVLRLTSDSTAAFESCGCESTYALSDGWIVMPTAAGVRRLTRLVDNAGDAGERWLAIDEVGGAPVMALELQVLRTEAANASFAAGDVERLWQVVGPFGASWPFQLELFSDGTGMLISGFEGHRIEAPIAEWAIQSDGTLTQRRRSGNAVLIRRWVLLQRTERGIWVIESQSRDGELAALPNIEFYLDRGPSAR